MRLKFFGPLQALYLTILLNTCLCSYELCDRRPLGTTTDSLPPDNRFMIDVIGLREDLYIPKQEYTVRLFSRDGVSTFIAFTISLREDTAENKNNPRKPLLLSAGKLEPLRNSNNTKLLTTCNNTVIQSDITPKTWVEAKWTAPEKDNKCVNVFALVAVKPDVWYNYEGPLSKRICEDRRKADDMQPMENDNCQVCEDASYKLTFEGMWSYNTHTTMYPSDELVARFSDVVGASHSKDFSLYKFNSEASEGLKLLAEQGNTTNLEVEIYHELGINVKTIIKATAPPDTFMKTVSTFRTSRKHHLVSLVTAILPSPDWFLGVANLELCDAKKNEWADRVIFNLYPMDAGTDSGKKFDSSNEATAPAQPISGALIDTTIPKEFVKPFARLVFSLIRTYYNPNCTEDMAITEDSGDEEPGDTDEGEDGGSDEEEQKKTDYRQSYSPATTTTTEEPAPSVDPESSPECPMTQWEDWQKCEGDCIEGKLYGYQIRFRNHMGDPAPACVKEPLTETQHCEEECQEEQEEEEETEGEEEEQE